ASITVPVMDGALKPNDRLERAASLAQLDQVDNLAPFSGRLVCSSGSRVVALGEDGSVETLFDAEGTVSCIATDGADALAVGIDGKGVRIHGGRHDGMVLGTAGSAALSCPTSALFLD